MRWLTQLQRYRDAEDREGPISWSGPVLAGDRLVLTASNGQMTFVSPTDGAVRTTVDIGRPVSLPPVVAGNRLYILDDDGRLTAYRG